MLVDEVRLTATCDLREDAAQRAASRFRAERAYTAYRRMFDEEELDGVLIAAPPAVHAEAGIEALRRGLHVYTEKPPAMSADAARAFRDAARAHPDCKVMMGTVQRHCPVHRMAKEFMARPEFGTPLVYEARYVCPGPGMRMDWGMDRQSDADMFRFFLLDHIIHHLDLARFFLGEIEAVTASRSRTRGEQYSGAILYRFASGVVGTQTICFRAPVFENRTFIAGDGPAWVETHNWTKLTCSVPGLPVGAGGYADGCVVSWDGGISYQDGVVRPGYREELTVWARAILDGGDCRANLEDGYREMALIDAIVRSAVEGREIAVPEEDA
jgi:myo-inositol 2-dehydrogenase/D-chiro-inositol 1-dehydrogenase